MTLTWQTQSWYTQLLKTSAQPLFPRPQVKNLLIDPHEKNLHPVETRSLRLAVWKVPGKVCKLKEFQVMLPNLSHIQGYKAQQLITNRLRVSGRPGVMKNKLIIFKHLWITLIFHLKNLEKGYSIEPWILQDLLFQHIMSTLMVRKHPKVCALLAGIFN